ncbi:MAG: hypothetical protein WDN31_06190 [Hyphomicrobium sp.]
MDDTEIASIIANLDRNPLGIGDDVEFPITLARCASCLASRNLFVEGAVALGRSATIADEEQW